ncbi:unnamed protein product [Caenorhabditis nigoni]
MQQNDELSPGYASLQLHNGKEYTVRGLFGTGGFGDVYRVKDENGRQYAAKMFLRRTYNYSSDRERQAYERIAQNPHINLLSLHLAGQLINPPPGYADEILITEACGPSIKDIMMRARADIGDAKLPTLPNYLHVFGMMRARGEIGDARSPSFSINDIKQIGRQIGEALFHLEKLKIYHLDIKTNNVVFTTDVRYEADPNLTHPIITMSDLQIKIIDYGSSFFHSKPGIPRHPMIVQPQNLRAPEVFMGIPYNEKSDVWSMGCLMGEMYIGEPIFTSKLGTTETQKQQSQFEFMVSRMDATIPRELIDLSRQGRRCNLNLSFLESREKNNNNNQDSLMNLLRENTDLPMFEFLKFILIFNPTDRPSFEEVIKHEFLTNF